MLHKFCKTLCFIQTSSVETNKITGYGLDDQDSISTRNIYLDVL